MRAMRLAVIGVLLSAGAVRADPPKQPRLDAHGFPLPDGAIARLGDLRFAQPGPITALAVSPDDKMIATAGDAVYLWDAATGRMVGKLPAKSHAQTLEFSRNGRLLAAGGYRGEIELWNVESRTVCWSNDKRKGQAVTGLRFLDRDRIVAVSDADCRVALWDVAKGSIARTWEVDAAKEAQLARLGAGAKIHSVALSPSGRMMAWLLGVDRYSRDENAVYYLLIQDTMSGRSLYRVTGNGRPTKVHLLDEGKRLLLQTPGVFAAGNSVIEVAGGFERFRFSYRLAYIISRPAGFDSPLTEFLAVSPDGKSLFSQDEVGTVRWDLTACKQAAEWRHGCAGIAFFSNGNRMVLARGARLYLYEGEPKPLRKEAVPARPPSLRYTRDGRLRMDYWPGRLDTWDWKTSKVESSLWRMSAPSVGRTPCNYSDCGTRFVYHTNNRIAVRDLVADCDLCHLAGFQLKEEQNVYDFWPAFSGDGKRVFLSNDDGSNLLVRWYRSDNGLEEGRLRIPKKDIFPNWLRPVWHCSQDGSEIGYFTPDSRFAVLNCQKKKVSFIAGISAPVPSASKETQFPAWHYKVAERENLIEAWRMNSDEAWRMNSDEPSTLQFALWDRRTANLIRHFELRPQVVDNMNVSWHFSPDARLVAAHVMGQHELAIYETASGRRRGIIRPPAEISDFAFAPDGKTLATSCADTTVLIWDIDRPLGKGKPLSFAKDGGDTLWQALGDDDAEAAEQAIWALVREPDKALPLLRQRLRPIFTPKERMRELIARLDSPVYEQRLQAADELKKLGELAVTPLRAALKKGPSLEQSRRLRQLLTHVTDIARPPACLRELRAVEALERIGSPAARELVDRLAGGTTDSLLTREAAVVVARWGRDDRAR